MARLARIVAPGVAHHITQRGNNRQDVFFVDDDRRVYLALLKEQCEKHGLKVIAYCLMTNHVHIVGVPQHKHSLARAIGRTHFQYARYVNRMHGRSGHLWQNRFDSCVLDPPHLINTLIYAERNPVRAGIVRLAWEYRWSSAPAHTGRLPDASGLLDLAEWRKRHPDAAFWRDLLRRPEDADVLTSIRQKTHHGRPLASDAFVSKLEHKLGRRLRPLPGGRPRKRNGKEEGRTDE